MTVKHYYRCKCVANFKDNDKFKWEYCTSHGDRLEMIEIERLTLGAPIKWIQHQPQEHTPDCHDNRRKAELQVRKYLEKWGNDYCKTCYGNGQFVDTFDPSPAGVSLSAGSMPLIEPCDDCIEKGMCPQCGEYEFGESLDFETHQWLPMPEICAVCGFRFGEDDGLPDMEWAECYGMCAEISEATEGG